MIKIWNIKESKKNPVPIQIKSHLGAITSLAYQNKNGNFNEIAALKAQEGINSITIS